jgi:hypothetical protein
MKMKNKGYKKGGLKKMKKGMKVKGYKAGGKFPDLTGDGKVTQADILKGRGVNVKKKAKGGTIKKMAKGGTVKKFKKGAVVDDPKVTKPKADRAPMTKERLLELEKKRKKSNTPTLRPKKRPDGVTSPNTRPKNRFAPPPTGPGGDKALPKPKASPKSISPSMPKRTTPSMPTTPKRTTPSMPTTPKRTTPSMPTMPKGNFDAEGRRRRSDRPKPTPESNLPSGYFTLAKGGSVKKKAKGGTIRKMTKGGTVRKNGGKSKVRGAGIARKGVRPTKMR